MLTFCDWNFATGPLQVLAKSQSKPAEIHKSHDLVKFVLLLNSAFEIAGRDTRSALRPASCNVSQV